MYRIIAVGRTCSVMTHIPVASLIRPISNHGFNLNQLNKVWHVWPGSIHGALVVELVEASTLSFHIVLTFPVQTILLRSILVTLARELLIDPVNQDMTT